MLVYILRSSRQTGYKTLLTGASLLSLLQITIPNSLFILFFIGGWVGVRLQCSERLMEANAINLLRIRNAGSDGYCSISVRFFCLSHVGCIDFHERCESGDLLVFSELLLIGFVTILIVTLTSS